MHKNCDVPEFSVFFNLEVSMIGSRTKIPNHMNRELSSLARNKNAIRCGVLL